MWNRDARLLAALVVVASTIARDSMVWAAVPPFQLEVSWSQNHALPQNVTITQADVPGVAIANFNLGIGQIDLSPSSLSSSSPSSRPSDSELPVRNPSLIEMSCVPIVGQERSTCSGTTAIIVPENSFVRFCITAIDSPDVCQAYSSVQSFEDGRPDISATIYTEPFTMSSTASSTSGITATGTTTSTTATTVTDATTTTAANSSSSTLKSTLTSTSSRSSATSISDLPNLGTIAPSSSLPVPTASPTAVPTSNRGLSTNARLGLVLGLVIGGSLTIILLLIYLLRRRRTQRRNVLSSSNSSSQPEHMMLTQNFQAENDNDHDHEHERGQEMSQAIHQIPAFSKDGISPATTASERGIIIAAVPSSSNSTTQDTTSRSDAETNTDSRGISSPTSFTRPYRDDEESTDEPPVYGDARHTPQIITSPCPPENRDSSVPASRHFLSEEGMSREEMERLEEEERRIDAAIAEAESRDRRRDR